MTKQVQRRRGSSSEHTSFTGAAGEISVNTTNNTMHVHDGSTAGGFESARSDLDNVSTSDITSGISGGTVATLTITSADINGGTLDNVTIGGSTAAAGNFTSGTFTGDVSFGDNNKAIFGAGSDLEIYHSGAGSFISDVGNGALHIRGTNLILQNGDGTKRFIDGNDGGAVEIHHADATNGIKLATTSTGVDVTGTITADGLTVDGSGTSIISSSDVDALKIERTTAGAVGVRLELENGNDVDWSIFNDGGGNLKLTRSGTTYFQLDADGDLSLYEDTGTTPKFFWDSSAERLGLGTSSPTQPLEVIGSTRNTLTPSDSISAGMLLSNSANTISANLQLNTGGGLDFYTFESGGAGWERTLTLSNSGNVGIGTASPAISGTSAVTLQTKGTSSATVGLIASSSLDGASSVNLYSGASSSDNPAIAFQNNLRFGSATDAGVGGFTERLRLDASGNLLVGTTSDNFNTGLSGARLMADGSIVSRSNGINYFLKEGTGTLQEFRYFSSGIDTSGTTVGNIVITTSSTSYNTSSDYRLKENVTDITDGIERVKQLDPKRFNFIGDSTIVDGFLAHEAQAVVPEAVTGEKDAVDADGNPDYQGIDQSKLVPLLTAALQEAITKIETLEAKVTALESA